jgi:uncharacterized protein (TIGR02246 family)
MSRITSAGPLAFLLALATAGCTMTAEAPPAAAQPDEAAIRQTIEAREQEWSAAFTAGDPVAVSNLYTEDAAQVEPAGDWVRGREAIAANMKKSLDTINVTLREDVPEEVHVAGDYVVEFGRYNLTATTKQGNRPVTSSGRYVVLWRQDADGVWRIHRDMGTEAPKKP